MSASRQTPAAGPAVPSLRPHASPACRLRGPRPSGSRRGRGHSPGAREDGDSDAGAGAGRQDRCKAALDACCRDVFAVGTRCCTERTTRPPPRSLISASRSLLSPRCIGPFRVLARTAANTHRLGIPATWRVFPEFNVERLRPYHRRPARLGGDVGVGPPAPVLGADGVPEHLDRLGGNSETGPPPPAAGPPRRAGAQGAGALALRPGDTWEPLESLTNCEAAIASFQQATGRSLPRPVPPLPPLATTSGAPPYSETAPPDDLGAAPVGRIVLYWWPDDGWQCGPVAHLCARGGLHLADSAVGRARRCAARRTRFSTPPTAPAGCFSRRPRQPAWLGPGVGSSCPPGPSLSLIRGSSLLSRLATGRADVTNGHSHRMFC